jgi:hypothetical protein
VYVANALKASASGDARYGYQHFPSVVEKKCQSEDQNERAARRHKPDAMVSRKAVLPHNVSYENLPKPQLRDHDERHCESRPERKNSNCLRSALPREHYGN